MSNFDDNDSFEADSGPWVVLSDGSTFDSAEDCEIAYLTRRGDNEVFAQNRGWTSGPGHVFDAADTLEIYSIPLRKIIKFYFENNAEEKDPML